MYSHVKNVFKKSNIAIQPYHGGSLTGGDCINLLKNANKIIDEIRSECIEILENKGTNSRISRDTVIATLEEHRRLFILQHSVYSKLRIVAPTEAEMKDTRNCVKEMERQWRKMAISVTPKAHLIFVHSADDQVRWNGLGDKVEDALERLHQKQHNHDYLTMRMAGSEEDKLRYQSDRVWIEGNPDVKKRIDTVKKLTKRNFSDDSQRDSIPHIHQKKHKREIERDDDFNEVVALNHEEA